MPITQLPAERLSPPGCRVCGRRPCRKFDPDRLGSSLCVVGAIDIPSDCPFRVDDEHTLRLVLRALSGWEIDELRAEALRCMRESAMGGSTYYAEGYTEAQGIESIVRAWKSGACRIVGLTPCRRADPRLRSFFRHAAPPLWLIDRLRRADEQSDASSAAIDEGAYGTEPSGPLTIDNLRWTHTDGRKKSDTPDTASEGDTVKLLADIDNYVEGAGVDFYIRDTAANKLLAKLHTRCRNRAAEVDWTVELTGAGDPPHIAFECEARSKLSGRCDLPITAPEVWGICEGPDEEPIPGVAFRVMQNDEVLYEGFSEENGELIVPFERTEEHSLTIYPEGIE